MIKRAEEQGIISPEHTTLVRLKCPSRNAARQWIISLPWQMPRCSAGGVAMCLLQPASACQQECAECNLKQP